MRCFPSKSMVARFRCQSSAADMDSKVRMMKKQLPVPTPISSNLRWFALVAMLAQGSLSRGVEIEGFTEPYRSVDVASPEQGIVKDVPVRVGDFVTKGQIVATLDDELHVIMRETARERKDATGRLDSAEAELRLRRRRYEKLLELREEGFGRKEEVDRAAADLDIAHAELKSVRDDLADKRWQYEKMDADLRRRVVQAPLNGVVVARLKEPGEFVAANEPNIVTIVDLDQLVAKFAMKQSLARQLFVGREVKVVIEGTGSDVTGVVDEVSPVIEAQSGTIKIKVRFDNPDRQIFSGQRCTIDLPVTGETDSDGSSSERRKVAIGQ